MIHSKDKEEHAKHLRTMLQTLRKHEPYAKLQKCEFWLNVVKVFGHIVSKEGIKVNPQKMKAVTEWLRATNITEVRSFLGSAGYYRIFVKYISKITLPLTNLLEKMAKFDWSDMSDLTSISREIFFL